jgi:hypothetical protein
MISNEADSQLGENACDNCGAKIQAKTSLAAFL